MILLLGSLLSSCSKHHASLPPDLSVSPRRMSTVPSALRVRGNVPTTAVQIPVGPVSFATGNNPWPPQESPRDWKYIVLHHTASHAGSVESIHETHLDKGWLGVGYHFVIGNGDGMGDGEIAPTFRWKQQIQGAHAGVKGSPEYNEQGIGVVLVGNFEESSPSTAQLEAVTRLVATLKREYRISTGNVVPHGELKATKCPGKHFPLAQVAASEFGYTLSQYTLKQSPPRVAGRLRSSKR